MEVFLRERRGRYYIYEKEILPNEKILVELPLIVSKHFHYDLGVVASSREVSFYMTYSTYPDKSTAVWTSFDKTSSYKAARAIKILNNSNKKQKVCMRIAF